MRSQPALLQRVEPRGDRRIAVAHRPVDRDAAVDRRERRGELLGLRARDGLQRRFVALAVPDLVVVAPLAPRPHRQDDQVEDQPPLEAVLLDHAAVGEKLLQIAPHRPVVGRIRRAEIDEQHADAARRDRRMVGGAQRGARQRRSFIASLFATIGGGGAYYTHVKARCG